MAAGFLLAGLVPTVGATAPPSKNPVVFQYVTGIAGPQDVVKAGACSMPGASETATLFFGYSETSPAGETTYASWQTLNSSGEALVAVQTGNARQTASVRVPANVYDHSNSHSVAVGARAAGTRFRAVWASWGNEGSCSVTLNGQLLSPAAFQGRATFLFMHDFTAGVGASAGVADAGVAQSWSRAASGYLFAFLSPEIGIASIDGPNGQHLSDDAMDRRTVLGVAQVTSGTWTYSSTYANETWGPLLWLIEVWS